MSRFNRAAAMMIVAAVFMLSDREATAQFNVIWPGSTVEGDVARGLGAYSMGLGLYNLNTAMGYSIWTDVVLRQNAAFELACREQAQIYNQRLRDRNRTLTNIQAKKQTRLTDDPTEDDVIRGDALNILIRKIADMTAMSPSALRSAAILVPGGTIEKAPLMLPSVGVIISSTRLTARNEWPLMLRRSTFDSAAKAYQHAIEQALEAISNGTLQGASVEAVDKAVRQLQTTLTELASIEDGINLNEARAFLLRLDRSVQFLRRARAERVLNEVFTYGGTTVGDLVAFLTRSKLQFGPAETPAERDLYKALHPLLNQQYASLQSRPNAQKRAG